MAVTYGPAAELRTGRGFKFTGKGDQVTIEWTNEYQVICTLDGGSTVQDIDPWEVATASGAPVVNQSIYYFGGKTIPFAICRNKTVSQDPQALAKWTVKATFQSIATAEADNDPIAPPAAITSLGTTEVASLGEIEKVLYEDKSTTPVGIKLPSGAYFAEPVMERIPVLTVKLTQYESSITYEQMLARKFKVNDDTYRTQAAGKWLIEHVEASTVSVQLSGGATAAALVTYTLVHSPLTEGWKKSLALIDYKHKVASKFVPNLEGDPLTASLTFVDTDGVKKVSQVSPDYKDFLVYDDIDFDSFLQA